MDKKSPATWAGRTRKALRRFNYDFWFDPRLRWGVIRLGVSMLLGVAIIWAMMAITGWRPGGQ